MNNFVLYLSVSLYCFVGGLKQRASSFISDENGDTNFLSIIVILGIAAVLGIAFIAFRNEIMETAETHMNNFLTSFGEDASMTIGGGAAEGVRSGGHGGPMPDR